MATLHNGYFGNGWSGKMGNLVFYTLNGKSIVRKIGKNTKPPTEKQLSNRMEMGLVMALLSSLTEFIRVSFNEVSAGTTKSGYNMAVSYNKKNAVSGVYPDIKIDYEKVMLSQGKLKPASGSQVTLVPEGLKFDWPYSGNEPWPQENDQLMAVAYFPLLGTAVYLIFGAARKKGTDILPLPADMLGAYMEVYLSFVSANRKYNSDSLYLGSLNK